MAIVKIMVILISGEDSVRILLIQGMIDVWPTRSYVISEAENHHDSLHSAYRGTLVYGEAYSFINPENEFYIFPNALHADLILRILHKYLFSSTISYLQSSFSYFLQMDYIYLYFTKLLLFCPYLLLRLRLNFQRSTQLHFPVSLNKLFSLRILGL